MHLRGLLGPLLLFAPSALLARRHDLGARSAGVERADARWPFVLGLWLRTWPLLTGVAGLIGWTAKQLGIDALGVASEVVLAASDGDFAAMAFLGVFVVPLAEELFFRGRLFARLAGHVGPNRANWIQAALFGLAHGWFYFPILTYLGWLLGRARLAGAGMGSLALAHALQNAVSFAVLAAMR
ncbi:MAG: CPBP family intramembrane metalloprotease [Planctomycetaceae bacterium]|nr:CPBP family intramembrane metalloprotease [Planctomycetaceae bacterium]